MGAGVGSDREAIMAAYDELDAAFDEVTALSLDALTPSELVALMNRRETLYRRQPAVDHRIINRLAAEADPKALGGTSLTDVLATALRISKGEARRRITDAELLGPRRALTSEVLEPRLPNHPQTQRRPHRMDPAPTPRHRPNPSEQLPPLREVPGRRRKRGRRSDRGLSCPRADRRDLSQQETST